MTGIARASQKLRNKISFGDYFVSDENQTTPDAKERKARKVYLISNRDMDMLKEIFSKRLHTDRSSSLSDLMSEAIHLLYHQEVSLS